MSLSLGQGSGTEEKNDGAAGEFVVAPNPLAHASSDQELADARQFAAERETTRIRKVKDFSPFNLSLTRALRAVEIAKASCGKKTTDAIAFSLVAAPTVVAYVLNNMNDSGLPRGLKWTGGLDGAYVNMIFSGMGVPKILGGGFNATRDFVKHGFDSTYMNPLQFAVMAVLFPVLMYGSFTISLSYNLGVEAGLEGLKKDGWDISDGFHNLMMYVVAQPQVFFNAVLTMPSMLAGARWATDRLFVSREDLALQHYVQGLRAKAERIERTENLEELTDLLTKFYPLVSKEFLDQRELLTKEAENSNSVSTTSISNRRAALKVAVTGAVVVSAAGMYLASVGGLAATVKEADSMPIPSRELTQGLQFFGMDRFGPALIGNLPNLAFAIFYGLPGVACLIDMFLRVRNNLDGASAAKIVGYVAYAITLGVILFSGVTSFAQGYNGGSALPAAIGFPGEVLLLCSLSFLAAFVSNLGGTFQYMYALHNKGLLALTSSCVRGALPELTASSSLTEPLLEDKVGAAAAEGKAGDADVDASQDKPKRLTPREEFETKLTLVKAIIAVLEAASAGSGEAAKREYRSLTTGGPLGRVASTYFDVRRKFLDDEKKAIRSDLRRQSVIDELDNPGEV
jgi:hypothetical protein